MAPLLPPPHEDLGVAVSVNAAVPSQEVPVVASSSAQVADSDSEPELDWLIPKDETDGADGETEHADVDEGRDMLPAQTAPSDEGPLLPLLKLPMEILGNIADEMDTIDFANLLRVNLQLKKTLLLGYMKRVGLIRGSSKIRIQGEFPLSAIRLLCDLPPFHLSKSSLDCELYFINHFPTAISRFLQNQPQITRVRIQYTEHYSVFITHPRLPRALQHTLTSLGPYFGYLDVDSTLGDEPSGRSDLPKQTDIAYLPQQVPPMNNMTCLRWIRLPVSCLIFDPVCQLFLSLLSTRTDTTLLVSNISSAEELNELLVKLPTSSIGYLALLYIGSKRPVVPDSAFLKFTNLHTFWFYHPYFDDIEPVALHLPPLRTLTLTPCFSTISMTDSSTLKEVHLTPCSFYDTSIQRTSRFSSTSPHP
ncbi:hypothetical protein EST38_g7818 [Candolleomyces aberdarensis]|uniref:F-box domain-containing protein n=1 Tax=Candolleomyces aberdarensis TaxID=2316362 RepID=A0A4Q2DG77_9AGAR|nr:hypothetical protein EST38_g7818 [Candolleomyces aberdarensis]